MFTYVWPLTEIQLYCYNYFLCWIIVLHKFNVFFFYHSEKPSHHDPVLRQMHKLSATFQLPIIFTQTVWRLGLIRTHQHCVNCQNMLNRIRWVCTKIHSLSVVSEYLYNHSFAYRPPPVVSAFEIFIKWDNCFKQGWTW